MKKYGEYNIIKYIGIALITGSMLLPLAASAASVHVLPTTTNSHEGKRNPVDFSNTITYQAGQFSNSMTGIGTYDLSQATTNPVDYAVIPTPMDGYTFTLEGKCSGTVAQDETAECEIDWLDNIPAPAAPQPTSPPATPVANPATTEAVASTPAIPPPPTVITRIIEVPVPATPPKGTTYSDDYAPGSVIPCTNPHTDEQTTCTVVPLTDPSTTTAQQIQDLQQRVGLLESLVAWMQNKLQAVLNFLGL